jgi:Holliday junction resolvase
MSRKTGNKSERGAVEIYEAAGYEAGRAADPEGGRYMTDLFGLFDVVAVPAEGPVRLCQVKTNTASGARSFFDDAAAFVDAEATEAEILVRHEGSGVPHPEPAKWRLLVPSDDHNYETAVDERKGGVLKSGEGVAEWLRG